MLFPANVLASTKIPVKQGIMNNVKTLKGTHKPHHFSIQRRCHAKYVALPNNSQYEICTT